MRYRRADYAGGCYFFTVNLANRRSALLVESIEILRGVMRQVMRRHPFHIDAMVVLPDHLHVVWTLPPNDRDFSTRWMLIKAGFSKHVGQSESISLSRQGKGERGIWQRRYWEHLIRDDEDYANHVAYIHHNPVKHGYVDRAADWPHSSIHRYIRLGLIPSTWGATEIPDGTHGERR